MAMGRRKRERQEALFVTAQDLPNSAGHPFYQALNRLLAESDFDRWVEARCARARTSRRAHCAANAQTARALARRLTNYVQARNFTTSTGC